jgi:hypothetical protein
LEGRLLERIYKFAGVFVDLGFILVIGENGVKVWNERNGR